MKSGMFKFHAPNMIVCRSISILPKRKISDTHSLTCSSKLLVTAHSQKKCSIDSFSVLHREHKGLSTILNFKRLSFKYKILFKFCTGMNIGMLQLLLGWGAYKLSSN